MKIAKDLIKSRKQSIPEVKFGDYELTSFGGLVVFQSFFEAIGFSGTLKKTCAKLNKKARRQYCHGKMLECIVIHLLIGFRNLRDSEYYKDDPLVRRTLKLTTIPSVPTISRMLSDFDEETVNGLHNLVRNMVVDRLRKQKLRRITIDFDGSIQSTTRHAEGTAVGFNKKKKGQRSYYPLYATIAQTTQILDFLHRPGNVHDSNGAIAFVTSCVLLIRESLPKAVIEMRMDSAFFSDEMVKTLKKLGVEFTISVPFERLTELKGMIEERKRWQVAKNGKGKKIGYFVKQWKPKSWKHRYRFLFIRTPIKKQTKGPLQLDLFIPVDEENKYKVIITNKKGMAGNVVSYHEGRGSQEKIFGEAKSQVNMDYIPSRKRVGNEVFLLCSVLVYNLNREMQMRAMPPTRKTTKQRSAFWRFEEMKTIRHKIIQTAGKLTRPQGKWTLNLPKNAALEREFAKFMPDYSANL